MAVYVIVAADNDTRPAPLSMVGALHAIAGALGVDSDTLAGQSVPMVGEWNGQREHSRAIRLSHPQDEQGWRDVHALADGLKVRLGQDAVMVLADETTATLARMGEVFEGVERVGIVLPGRDEAARENMGTSRQTDGEPVIPGVRNGSRWTTRPDEYGSHVQAFV